MQNPIHQHRTMSLFDTHAPREKGSREWSAFSAVREDRAGMFRVALPQKALVIKSANNLLRIIAPYSRSHAMRGAH